MLHLNTIIQTGTKIIVCTISECEVCNVKRLNFGEKNLMNKNLFDIGTNGKLYIASKIF